jgi:hypothetical protein
MMDDTSLRMLQLKMEGYCCSQIIMIIALEAQAPSGPGNI